MPEDQQTTVVAEPPATSVVTPTEPPKPWYDDWGFDPEQLKTISRYKTRENFGKAFFDQRKTIAEGIHPPDPNATAEENLAQLRAARLRLGALDSPDKYTVNVPDDLKEYVEKNMPDLIAGLRKDAARYGMTQWELDKAVEDGFAQIREAKTQRESKEKEARDLEIDRKIKNDDLLDRTFGKRKEKELDNAVLMAEHFDDTLFFADNEGLPEEVRAEKGGLLTQHLRKADDPVLWRLFASLHRKLLAEPRDMLQSEISGAQSNVYQDRYARAKQMYPKRPESWDSLAKDLSVPL